MASRSTGSAPYENARAAAFMGYKLICQREGIRIVPDEGSAVARWTDPRWNGYFSNLTPSEFRSKFERSLPESLSGVEFLASSGQHVDPFTRIDALANYPVRSAARYAVEENHRVRMFHGLLSSGAGRLSESSLQLAGELFCQSHVAYEGCGLGSEACDELVERVRHAGLPGAKMTGGGGGGVVAILGRAGDARTIQTIAGEFGAERGSQPRVFEGSSMGADAFGVRELHFRAAPNER
jgi:galactokinase